MRRSWKHFHVTHVTEKISIGEEFNAKSLGQLVITPKNALTAMMERTQIKLMINEHTIGEQITDCNVNFVGKSTNK